MASNPVSANRLERCYEIGGLDRILYTRPAVWPEGEFTQDSSTKKGFLSLHAVGIHDRRGLAQAQEILEARAQAFRLALSHMTSMPVRLRMTLESAPDLDPPGSLSSKMTISCSVTADLTCAAKEPPVDLPQLPEWAARWIWTFAETRELQHHPDEVLQRFYLIIEELWDPFSGRASAQQIQDRRMLRYLRNFVSHSECDKADVCGFIAAALPSAVVASNPLRVRFDRTLLEHLNFVGKHEPIARQLARDLISDAITRRQTSPP